MATENDNKSYDLSKFHLERILYNNSKNKSVCVLGNFIGIEPVSATKSQADNDDTLNFPNNGEPSLNQIQRAIIILEKTAFTEKDVNTCTVSDDSDAKRIYFAAETRLEQQFVNDIYGNFECLPIAEINKVKAVIICPVTDKHISKYEIQSIHIVQETPAIYARITEPRINKKADQFALTWVYNILEHKQEEDRIVFEDPCKDNGFILLPDLKWDGKTLETLYLIAIVHRHNLTTIRSLTDEHLPLLRNIRDKGINAITERYGIPRSQLRIYFHYQPSFYHLHIHFTYLKHDAPGIFCEKSHLLDTVISNIELLPAYYQRSTLSFVIRENDPDFKEYNLVNRDTNDDEVLEVKAKIPHLE